MDSLGSHGIPSRQFSGLPRKCNSCLLHGEPALLLLTTKRFSQQSLSLLNPRCFSFGQNGLPEIRQIGSARGVELPWRGPPSPLWPSKNADVSTDRRRLLEITDRNPKTLGVLLFFAAKRGWFLKDPSKASNILKPFHIERRFTDSLNISGTVHLFWCPPNKGVAVYPRTS